MVELDYLLFLIFFLAALLHGMSGMAFPVLVTAVVAGRYSLNYAILVVLFPALLINLLAWLVGGKGVFYNLVFYARKYWLLALMSLLGGFFGTQLLFWVDSAYLMLVLAAVIGIYVWMTIRQRAIILPDNYFVLLCVGFLAGAIGGATNAMSPILLMYLLSMSDDKYTIAKAGNFCYFVGKVAQIIILYPSIISMGGEQKILVVWLTIISCLGLLLGIRAQRFLPQKYFKRLVVLILFVLGVKVGWRGIELLNWV